MPTYMCHHIQVPHVKFRVLFTPAGYAWLFFFLQGVESNRVFVSVHKIIFLYSPRTKKAAKTILQDRIRGEHYINLSCKYFDGKS